VGSAGLAAYAGCFVLAVKGQESEILGGYKSFKLVSFFLPFFALALVSLLAVAKSRYKRLDVAIKLATVMAVIGGYVMADRIMLRPTRYSKVESEYETLRGLERTNSVESINVSSGDYWPTMWIAYFLIHKKLYLENPSYYVMSEPLGEYDLVDKVGSQLLRVKPVAAQAIKVANERFALVGPVQRKVRAKFGTGWYLGEVGQVWSGKDGKRSSIILHALDDGVRVRLRFLCSPLRGNDHLRLQAGGEEISAAVDVASNGPEEIRVSDLVLKKGDTEVDIISELEPTQPNATDPRPVSYSFRSIEVEEL
jgi:hypothetical protein